MGSSCSHPISADIPHYVDATGCAALPQNFVFQELHTQQGSQGNARTARVKNDARH